MDKLPAPALSLDAEVFSVRKLGEESAEIL
jgi:hypothetical protein